MSVRNGALLLTSLCLACASGDLATLPLGRPAPQAQVSVEILHGFVEPVPRPHPEHVQLLIDATTSMERPAAPGVRGIDAARAGAARLLRGLPAAASVGLTVLGADAGECQSPSDLVETAAGAPREPLLAALDGLSSAGEGSLAGALDLLAAGLASQPGARVVVFSDLRPACGGDLCRAVSALVGAGAQLDLVVLGSAPTPECVEAFALDDAAPAGRDGRMAAPAFRVEAGDGRAPTVLARGLADGTPVEVEAGTARLVVDLDPPAVIGPVLVSPAALTHVRVLEFPYLEPRVREWRWSTVPLEQVRSVR